MTASNDAKSLNEVKRRLVNFFAEAALIKSLFVKLATSQQKEISPVERNLVSMCAKKEIVMHEVRTFY